MKEAWHLDASDATSSLTQIDNVYPWEDDEPGRNDTKDLRRKRKSGLESA